MDDQDRVNFLQRLRGNIIKAKSSVYAWVLMSNHTRALIAYRSIEELGLSTAEIARHLGVATSTVTRAIARGEALNSVCL
ncbi:hypothetical protein BMS3Abin07_00812 [bacterium BMS3Abin07]|nr:hypothetical protein BMS3Abin07_00812 [bacterium BMS3Abin07]GBE33251.1 hypothetical protein BMS3Bbin05_02190 [bacterium BMS3Bbin05]HDO23252.1 hypothetical protein [Nitrospirota bacterium]